MIRHIAKIACAIIVSSNAGMYAMDIENMENSPSPHEHSSNGSDKKSPLPSPTFSHINPLSRRRASLDGSSNNNNNNSNTPGERQRSSSSGLLRLAMLKVSNDAILPSGPSSPITPRGDSNTSRDSSESVTISPDTPKGVKLEYFADLITVIPLQKTKDLGDGWIERKKRAIKAACLSEEYRGEPIEFGSIVYQVNATKKICKMAFENIATDFRQGAELKKHLMSAVQKEIEDEVCDEALKKKLTCDVPKEIKEEFKEYQDIFIEDEQIEDKQTDKEKKQAYKYIIVDCIST